MAGKRENVALLGRPIERDAQAHQLRRNAAVSLSVRRPLRSFTISVLRTSNHQRLGTRASSARMRFSANAATGWSSSSKAQHAATRHRARRASVFVSLMFRRQELVDGDFSDALPQCLYARDCSVDFGLLQMRFRHDPGDCATMSRDDYGLPALDVIEELGEVNLGLRGLNFAHVGITVRGRK